MPRFHNPASYDFDEHTGFKEIFDGKSFSGWDADSSIWRVENGIMVGETFEGKPKGNNYIAYRAEKTRDFDLKLRMKIERGGGGGSHGYQNADVANLLRSFSRMTIAPRLSAITRAMRNRVVAKTIGLAASESGDWKPRS